MERVNTQEVFRHLLGVERSRAERCGGSLVLVLLSLRGESGSGVPLLPAAVASGVFEVLDGAVREVDVVGWYRERTVIGAILVQRHRLSPDARRELVERVMDTVRAALPDAVWARLRIRAAQSSDRGGRMGAFAGAGVDGRRRDESPAGAVGAKATPVRT